MKKKLTLKRKLLYGFLALVLVSSIYSSTTSDNTASDTKENPSNVSRSVTEPETVAGEIPEVNAESAEVITPEAEVVVAPVAEVVVPVAVVEPTPSYTDDTANSAQVETIVYVTKTGSKYHSAGCQYLSKSSIPISLSDARASYSPCSKCNPPR